MTSAILPTALPLDDAELSDLKTALVPRSIEEATGFLAAIGSIPAVIAEGVWLVELLSEGVREDAEKVERVLPLVARVQRHVSGLLFEDEIESLVPPAEDAAAIRRFCAGYVDVIDQIEVDDEDESVLADLFALELLAGRVSDEELKEVLEPGATIEAYVERAREDLPEILSSLYEAWETGRKRNTTVRRDVPKVGRNERCPCGSGKKHKKCCGALN